MSDTSTTKAPNVEIPLSGTDEQFFRATAPRALGEEGSAAAAAPPLAGYYWKQDWGLRNGWWDFDVTWGAISPNSKVFVSAGEGKMGSAVFTVHNVVPYHGGIKIRVHIDWSSPIQVYVDYLVFDTYVLR